SATRRGRATRAARRRCPETVSSDSALAARLLNPQTDPCLPPAAQRTFDRTSRENRMLRRFSILLAIVALAAGLAAAPRHLVSPPAVAPDFTHFEGGKVPPATLTPSRDRLLVLNTPDGYLSVFDVTGDTPVLLQEIPVGLEPVTVAAPSDSVAWVVNNLS